MNGTIVTILMLGGALAAGGAAAYFANEYIDESLAERRAELDAQYSTVKVIVAAQDLRPGTILSAQTVAVREVPNAFLHEEAIRAERWGEFAGRVLARPLRSGEPVLLAHMAKDPSAGFSAQLADGMRALTFPVDEESSIAGMLAPGDRIDLFFTTTHGNETTTLPLLANVQVIATGMRTLTNEHHPEVQGQRHYRTVTVLVTPQDAAKITLAQDAGKLTITLRRPLDEAPLTLSRITKQHLLFGEPTTRTSLARRKVEIILGGV
jgi:pilus assembly protein CpaB